MPIEIRELVIKVSLENQERSQPPMTDQETASDRQTLLADCVEQVMDIIKQREER